MAMWKDEADYEFDAKEYIYQLPQETQRKAVTAVHDLLDDGKSWEFVATALKKKSMGNWITHGMGLLFNPSFQANVYRQIDRDRKSAEIDLDEFFDIKTEIEEHLAEVKGYEGSCHVK